MTKCDFIKSAAIVMFNLFFFLLITLSVEVILVFLMIYINGGLFHPVAHLNRWHAIFTISLLIFPILFYCKYFKNPTALRKFPGFLLRSIGEFVFSAKTFRIVIEPILRDLFDEYCEALAAGRPFKARWVCIRGYYSFWSAFVAQLPISAVKMVYKIWKATR